MLALGIPWFHSGVVIDYDIYGLGLYFLLIPAMSLAAFAASPPRRSLKAAVLTALALLAGMTLIFARSGDIALFITAGAWSYLSTFFIFRFRWRLAAVPEVLFLASVYLRLINFTRGLSPEISASALPQTLMFTGIAALSGHFLVVMLAMRKPGERHGESREFLYLAGLGIPLLLAAAMLIPPNFVSHSIVLNQLFDPPKPDPKPLDGDGDGKTGGNLLGDSLLGRSRRENGQPGLYGLPADRWGETGEGSSDGTGGTQYAVMVVASPQDPTYLADAYFDRFDPLKGFGMLSDQPLNRIVSRRLLETWNNTEIPRDRARLATEIFTLSTIPDRVLAYLPLSAEPTIYDRSVYPFTYSYPSVSAVSVADPYDWLESRDFRAPETAALSEYTNIDLDAESLRVFSDFLDHVIQPDMNPGRKVLAILKSFQEYQYEIGFDENMSVEAMRQFLSISRSGDCTEFSNTAAILGRLAGIPSRVVTGYLASSGLQTFSHLQGLYLLQQNIPVLQKYSLEQLFLVTSAHRHSWTQFYLPDYGWIDFETTQFAIPPLPGGDPNSRDVVIPLIEDRTVRGTEFSIPWRLLGQTAAVLFFLLLTGLYSYRYGREFILRRRMAGTGKSGLLAAESLLITLLANEGVPLKKRSETPLEYTATVPELKEFALLYDQLRFRERMESSEREKLKQKLIEQISLVTAGRRRRGIAGFFLRLFTLRGIVSG